MTARALGLSLLALACQANDPPPRVAPPTPVTAPSPAPTVAPLLPPTPPPTAPVAALAAPRRGVAAGVTYVELVTGGASADARLPWIIAMHGLGDNADDFATLYAQLPTPARVFALQGVAPFGPGGWQWFPPGDADRLPGAMRDATSRVVAAAREITTTRPVCGMPVATGFSQGAMMSFSLAAQRPAVLLGAVPIAGRLPSALYPSGRGAWPELVAIHGTADGRIPFAEGERTVEAFRRLSAPVTLLRHEGVGHTVTPMMRRDLYEALSRLLARADCNAAR